MRYHLILGQIVTVYTVKVTFQNVMITCNFVTCNGVTYSTAFNKCTDFVPFLGQKIFFPLTYSVQCNYIHLISYFQGKKKLQSMELSTDLELQFSLG